MDILNKVKENVNLKDGLAKVTAKVSDMAQSGKENASNAIGQVFQKVTETSQKAAQKTGQITKNTIGKIGEKSRRAKANANAFLDRMIAKLMAKINIGKTIKSLEEYQQTSGKDVSDLINFLKKTSNCGLT